MKRFLEKAEEWIWYAFLATALWQTRIILWHADPVFNEWRSASIFGSDVLFLVLVILAAILARGRSRSPMSTGDWLMLGLIAAAIASLSQADHLGIGVYGVIKLGEFVGFFFYVRRWAVGHFNADRSAIAFVVGGVSQAFLGISQYMLQRDVGIRWIGETLLRVDMRGVAVFIDATHDRVLRAYGTLPHPNVLAMYMLIVLWVFVWLWIRHGRSLIVVWCAGMAIIIAGLFVTFSRTVIAAWVLSWVVAGIVVYWNRMSRGWPHIRDVRDRLRPVVTTTIIASAILTGMLWPQMRARLLISSSDEAVRQRVQYASDALATGSGWSFSVNWTGVGVGNFTTWLARYDRSLPSFVTQPAHNVFLMIYSEVGFMGLIVFIAWLWAILRNVVNANADQPLLRFSIGMLVVVCIGVGMTDHFFWTLQQGRLLWFGVMALAAGEA